LADLAATFSLTAVVEGPIYGRLISTLPLLLRLVRESGSANLALCIDTYQLFRCGASVESLSSIPPGLLGYVQLTDGTADAVGFRVPGQGSVPLADILAALPKDLVIGLECPAPKDSSASATDWLRTVLTGAREVLAQQQARV